MSFRDTLINYVRRTGLVSSDAVQPQVTTPDFDRFEQLRANFGTGAEPGMYPVLATVAWDRIRIDPTDNSAAAPATGEIVWTLTLVGRTREIVEDVADKMPFYIMRQGEYGGNTEMLIYNTACEDMVVYPSERPNNYWEANMLFRSEVSFPY